MLSESVFRLHQTTRNTLLAYLETLSSQQLAHIPAQFSNHIFWNIAHCVATQQILCYKLSGLPLLISEEFLDTYKKGSFPTKEIPSPQAINELKTLLVTTQKQLHEDYKKGLFKNFSPYPTSYGFDLQTIEDAIQFNNTHEGMHLGTIKALLYFV